MACLVCLRQTVRVGFVQEDLGLQDLRRFSGHVSIFVQRQINQDLDGRASLHVGKLLEGGCPINVGHLDLPQDDVLQKRSLHAGGAGRSGKDVVDEEVQRRLVLGVVGVLDLVNDFRQQGRVINGFGVQAVGFAVFDFLEVRLVLAHRHVLQ